jgi:hypothetical protein
MKKRTLTKLRAQKRASRKRLGDEADKPTVPDVANPSAKLVYCPTCEPSDDSKLVRKNISLTHAIKACRNCKRKLTYIRTDTPQGRTLRQKVWRDRTALGLSGKEADGTVID